MQPLVAGSGCLRWGRDEVLWVWVARGQGWALSSDLLFDDRGCPLRLLSLQARGLGRKGCPGLRLWAVG